MQPSPSGDTLRLEVPEPSVLEVFSSGNCEPEILRLLLADAEKGNPERAKAEAPSVEPAFKKLRRLCCVMLLNVEYEEMKCILSFYALQAAFVLGK